MAPQLQTENLPLLLLLLCTHTHKRFCLPSIITHASLAPLCLLAVVCFPNKHKNGEWTPPKLHQQRPLGCACGCHNCACVCGSPQHAGHHLYLPSRNTGFKQRVCLQRHLLWLPVLTKHGLVQHFSLQRLFMWCVLMIARPCMCTYKHTHTGALTHTHAHTHTLSLLFLS